MIYPIAIKFSDGTLHVTTHRSQSRNKPQTVTKQWIRQSVYTTADNPTITAIFVFKDEQWHRFNVVKRNDKLQLE